MQHSNKAMTKISESKLRFESLLGMVWHRWYQHLKTKPISASNKIIQQILIHSIKKH